MRPGRIYWTMRYAGHPKNECLRVLIRRVAAGRQRFVAAHK